MNLAQRLRVAPRLSALGNAIPLGAAILLLLLQPRPALAQLAATVNATGQYQYNTNVFDLQRGFAAAPNYSSLAASYYAYGAGLLLNEQVSQQNFYLRGGDTEFVYDHFGLTHDEYNVDGGWAWKLLSNLSGSFDISRARTMVPYTQIIAVELLIATDQNETARIHYEIVPDWVIDAHAYTDRYDEPLPGEPNLRLLDSGAGGALRFGGMGEWVGDLSAEYQHGDYQNATLYLSPSYNQWAEELGAIYRPAGEGSLSTIDMGAGYTSRISPDGVDDLSGWTGHVNLARQLTGKTSVRLGLLRDISSYVTNAGAEVDTEANPSVVWQATYKTGFTAGYTWLHSVYPDQGPTAHSDRDDHLQFATFYIDYAALRWLTIKPYINYQTRSSNLYGANFNATQYGVSFLVQWQNSVAAAGNAATGAAPVLGH